MLKKLLFKNQDKKQLIIAMIGAFMGITFLVTSIHYLIKVNEFGKGTEILGPNTIIVQKKVTSSSSLGLTKTDFSPREIEKLKEYPFINDVKPVVSNNFKVWFQTDDPLVPEFKTDAFIQTVDSSFLDVNTSKWDWKEADEFVPIIMPRDILVMLNTFMSASDIPQVSEEVALKVKFKFRISKGAERKEFQARIIGFTNEVSAVLVPEAFMNYGNVNFAEDDELKITQVMISGNESEFGLLEELLNKKGLESKKSQVVIARLKSVVGTLIMVVLGISVIAVFVSGLVLIQYMQLLMTKNAYEVRTLLRIGYSPKLIVNQFFIYFVKIFGIIAMLGLLAFIPFKLALDNMFETGGLYIDTGITWISIGALFLAYALFALSSFFSAKKGIFDEY
ncbi:MAG: FtsX-like permease family protein [Crocinitomicaceae bacterium]